MTELADLAIASVAAAGAGLVNALAGGGTLISFPVLVALGVPPLAANVTNAVALCPGYFGATLAQRANLIGQREQLRFAVPAGVIGGVAGGAILLATGERMFGVLVPYMLVLACVLLAIQEPVRRFIARRVDDTAHAHHATWSVALPVCIAGIYGGYFSAGMSVIVLAVLGLILDDSLTRLNALKQAVAFSVNVAATVFFLFSGQVRWSFALVMAIGALAGGALGGRLAGKLPPAVLRWTVVTIGLLVAIAYFVRGR
jgi:uncharacterized membrane protein YfcA